MRESRSSAGTDHAPGASSGVSPGGSTLGVGKRTAVEAIQFAGAPAAAASAVASEPASGGAPLPDPLRGKMEHSFGADFSGVSVHQDGRADAMGAHAYAQGEHVHFGAGRYDPASHGGQALIGHELAHVVQQREGRASVPQGKGAAVVADPGLEAEADRQGELAAQGLPAGAGSTAGAAGAGAAIQRKGPTDPPAPGTEPPAGQTAQTHTFAVPTIPPLAPIPDAVNRNQVINQTYHVIDGAMTGYLGDPLVSNWFTYGQHASREAGTEIRALQEGLQLLQDALNVLLSINFSNPIASFGAATTAIRMFRRILDLINTPGLVKQGIQLALAKAGISTNDIQNLVNEAQTTLIESPTIAMNPIAAYHMIRFIAHVDAMVGKLVAAIPSVITALQKIYDNMKTGNREIYENVAPAAHNFLAAAQSAPNGVPGAMAFAGDTNGFLAAAFTEYGEVRRLGDEARAAPGTPDATTKLQQRHDKAMHANLLIGFQEQLVILQPIFNTMMQELTAMNGTMVLHDPNGVHPLHNNWGDFYTRMGIDPTKAPADPRTITPNSLPPLLPASQRQGTISSYFNDNVDNEKIHEAPPPISPG